MLQPIADELGEELVRFTLHVSAANISIDVLRRFSEKNMHMRKSVLMLVDALSALIDTQMKDKGWKWEDLTKAIAMIGRAQENAGPRIIRPD